MERIQDQLADLEGKELDILSVYGLFWRWIALAVHSYGSAPSGQLLVVATMILLDRVGYRPTVTELAAITQLPKSSISRYVAAEMNAGMIEEFIDPHDRRRRRLRPTAVAEKEREWHSNQLMETFREITRHAATDAADLPGPETVVSLLTRLNRELIDLSRARAGGSD